MLRLNSETEYWCSVGLGQEDENPELDDSMSLKIGAI